MTRLKDPYLAGWNAAIEAAAKVADGLYGDEAAIDRGEMYGRGWDNGTIEAAGRIRALTKPKPIPDDHWRRVNDGDWDYDPPRKGPTRD
jgi:hypothetical protein